MERVTEEEWRSARAHDFARIWDGRRYMLGMWMHRPTAEPVWREVEVIHPLIRRERREG